VFVGAARSTARALFMQHESEPAAQWALTGILLTLRAAMSQATVATVLYVDLYGCNPVVFITKQTTFIQSNTTYVYFNSVTYL